MTMGKEPWQHVENHDDSWFGDTHRMKVPGGWLYRCREWSREYKQEQILQISVVFVPDEGKA